MKRSNLIGLVMVLITGVCFTACSSGTNKNSGEIATAAESSPDMPAQPFEDIDAATFRSKMQADNTVILDVRTPGETQEGMIENAVAIDFTAPDFLEKIGQLDKDKTYLVYCQSGGRSARACEKMSDLGFQKLYNLEGGYMVWPKE